MSGHCCPGVDPRRCWPMSPRTMPMPMDDANAHGMPDPNSLDEKLKVARAAVSQDPKVVAQVIKNWVATDG